MTAWYRDRAALRLIAWSYIPWFAVLSLVWELAQLPLYTIWRDGSPGYVAFAVAHCLAGDILIGAAALAIALVITRAPAVADWHWLRIATVATLVGAGYTLISEWLNTSIRRSWEYSELMPTIEAGGATIGLSPLGQWLILPPLALYIARRRRRSRVRFLLL